MDIHTSKLIVLLLVSFLVVSCGQRVPLPAKDDKVQDTTEF